MSTVAIVGFSDKTLPYLKDARPDEIWTLNHAYLVLGEQIPRIDRLFEIHKKEWFLRKEVPKSQAYWEWLQQPHVFPIYMQEANMDVPSSVTYPFKEVCDDIFANLLRKVGEEYISDTYFTSSAAYMLALAIHERFDRIELYGVDMESDTEYGYQKPCGEFMLGLACGRGIETVRPEVSELCRSALYGYETVPYVDRNRLAEIHQLYQEEKDKRDQVLSPIIEGFKPEDEEMVQRYMNESAWAYIYQGAMLACERFLMESDYYISRQIVEIKRANFVNNAEYFKGMTNQLRAEYNQKFKKGQGDPNIYGPVWKDYITHRAEMFGNMGAVQVSNKLMHLIDFRPVDFALTMDIKEN